MDLQDALRRLEAAQGDPDALAIATVDIALASEDPILRRTLDAAAVPHWFDETTLRALLGGEVPSTSDWFDQLVQLSVVEVFRAHSGWNVHEVTRLALRGQLAREQPERFRDLSTRAAALFSEEQWSHSAERVYHLLTSRPEDGAHELRRLVKTWEHANKQEWLQSLGRTLDELRGHDMLDAKPKAYALIALGTIRGERIGLAVRRQLSDEALALATALDDDVALIEASLLRAGLHRDLGQFAEALQALENASARLTRAGEAQPNSTLDTEELRARINQATGRTLQDRGQLNGALVEFEAALVIRKRQSESAPEDDYANQELATAYADIGDALIPIGRAKEAEHLYQKALELLERRHSTGRISKLADENIGRLRVRLADALHDRGMVAEALEHFHGAAQIFADLTRADPEHFVWRCDSAEIDLRLAHIFMHQNRPDQAEERLAVARSTFVDLTERDPASSQWQARLANNSLSLACLREDQGRGSDAAHAYLEAERLLLELCKADPERVAWRLQAATAQLSFGLFLGRLVAALPDDDESKGRWLVTMVGRCKTARDSIAEAAEADPTNVYHQSSLAHAEWALARASEKMADQLERGAKLEDDDLAKVAPEQWRAFALGCYRASVNVAAALVRHEPENVNYRSTLANSHTGGARLLALAGDRALALQLYGAAFAILSDLARVDASNRGWSRQLSAVENAMTELQEVSPESVDGSPAVAPPQAPRD